jgi:hypothetical protein
MYQATDPLVSCVAVEPPPTSKEDPRPEYDAEANAVVPLVLFRPVTPEVLPPPMPVVPCPVVSSSQ